MAIKLADNKYRCSYCDKEYSTYQKADACLERHDLIYIPISREDLGRLIQFLYLKNEQLLTETLVKTLEKYNVIRIKQPELENTD